MLFDPFTDASYCYFNYFRIGQTALDIPVDLLAFYQGEVLRMNVVAVSRDEVVETMHKREINHGAAAVLFGEFVIRPIEPMSGREISIAHDLRPKHFAV